MKSRLERYRQFIENDFIPSLVWNKDYKMNLSEDLTNKLKTNISNVLSSMAWVVQQ